MTTIVSLVIVVVAMGGLGVQAVRGNRTVSVQRDAVTVRDANIDDAFYRCIEVQARSLVSPRQPVWLDADLGDLVTLLKGVGSWVTIADSSASAAAILSVRNDVSDRPACLGTVVVASYPARGGRARQRVGSGASVPGQGPPPAPPL